MEHGLILLIEAILAIDRNLQKPVRAVVSEFGQLRAEPRAFLADNEIVIGPRRAYAVSGVIGILVATVVLVGFIMTAVDRPKQQPIDPWYFVAAGLSILVSGAAATALALRWLRGGSAILQAEGVEFVYRGKSVFCPWTLFQAAGKPYQPDQKRVILPAIDATPVAISDGEGNVIAKPAEEVKSKPLTGTADGQIALADLYEVKLAELGELLLHLGRHLGDGRLRSANGIPVLTPAGHQPAAALRPDGWLRVRLTRLPFPPVCLGCGVSTREAIQHVLDQRNGVRIDLPLCRACQSERTSGRRRAVMYGILIGLAPAAVAVVLGSPFLDVDELVLMGFVLLFVGMFLGLIGGLIARDRVDPAKFKEYSSSAGTVSMRLRPTPGTAAFLRALGIDTEVDPANPRTPAAVG
jgi:hypothetical protein